MQYHASKCSVLVCGLGPESLQKECVELVRDLWSHGISADLLYDSMEKDSMDDVQLFCKEYKIPHLVVLGDKTLLINGKVYLHICDRLQENREQRGTLRKKFFCTYRVVGVQILSSPSFIVVA